MKIITKLLLIHSILMFFGFSNQIFAQGETCATAIIVTPGTYIADGPLTGYGAENGCYADANNADWYSYTAIDDGTIDISSCLGGVDTRLSVYSGSCSALVCHAYSDDDCEMTPGGDAWAVELTDVPVDSGTTYYFEWDDRWSTSGFNWTLTFTAISPTTYYVDQNHSAANDTNTGTEAQPWLTIQKAANTLIAGDTVFIKTGVYNEQIIPQNSGSQGNYIVYMAYPDDTVTIDGTGISFYYADGLFDIVDKSYIICDGFSFTNSSGSGVRIAGSHLIVRNNKFNSFFEFSAIRTAWSGDASDIIVENNEINRTAGRWAEMISISDCDGIIVRYNHIISNPVGEGIDFKDGTSNGEIYGNIVENTGSVGIYLDARGIMSNFEIYNNIVHTPNHSAITLACESDDPTIYAGAIIENCNIFNNIFYGSLFGIRIAAYGEIFSGTPIIRNINVINNVFFENQHNDIGLSDSIIVENLTIRNNIFSKNDLTIYNSSASTVIDNNLFYDATPVGTNYVIGDPLFYVTIAGDFHIQSTSPAIDVGSSVNAPDFDFDGNPRPQGAGYDIGAYEYVNPVAIYENIKQSPNLLSIYPNPTNNATTIYFIISEDSKIELNIYNQLGQKIATLTNRKLIKGKHSVVWNGRTTTGEPVVSGIYFCKMSINNNTISKKIMLLK